MEHPATRWHRGSSPPRLSWSGIGKAVTSFWYRVGLSLSVLALLLTRVDVHEAARSLASVDLLYFLAAMVADVAARTVMIGRWVVLLRAGGQSVSTWSMARIFFISSFVSTALPTGSADVIRACALSQSGVGGQAATASVVVDRILGVVSLLLLGLVSLASGIPEANLPPLARLVAGLCLVASVVMLFGALWTDRLAGAILPQPLRRSAVGQWLLLTAGEIASYRSRRGVLIGVLGLCLAVQWLRITEVFLLGLGLGIDVGLGYYFISMPIALIILMLPVSIAGLGVPQGVIIWLLQPAGVPAPDSFALSTLVVVLGVLGTLPGFYLYLRTRGNMA